MLEASSAFCIQNFLKGSTASQRDRKWKCYPDPWFPKGKLLLLWNWIFFLGTDVSKLQYNLISFSVMWNATIPAKVLRNAMTHIKTVNYVAEVIQAHFSLQKHSVIFYMKNYYKYMCQKVLPSVNPGSCDIGRLTLVSFSSNWNKIKCLPLKNIFQGNQCTFNNKGRILYCYTDMRWFI